MSQRINHRREGKRYQDNGPTYENRTPGGGCNSTHVARARRGWRTIGRRIERRTGKRSTCKVHYQTGAAQQIPEIDLDEFDLEET